MKKIITRSILALVVMLSFATVTAGVVSVETNAIDVFSGSCGGAGGGAATGGATGGGSSDLCGAAKTDSAPNLIKNVINMLLYLIGIIAVVVIVIGGIRYVTSNGDSSATKGAKDTILYAVVGLVIAIMAFAIVNFVIDAFN